MKTIRKIYSYELEKIKTNALNNSNKEILFSYLDAGYQKYNIELGKWINCYRQSGGPKTSKEYESFLGEKHGNYYIIQSKGSKIKRYKFTKEEAINLGFI